MAIFEDSFGGRSPQAGGVGGLRREAVDVAALLARWRAQEIGLVSQFRACVGASEAEVEDLYDETVAMLVEKRAEYESAQHLRRTLHRGIKLRALRLHRDRRRRRRRLEGAAPMLDGEARERDWRMQPERALVAREDDVVIGEFVAELTEEERDVFVLVAAGRSWRAIATALGLEEPRARALTRACERKRERFLALYETGRLCGYRSRTIGLLVAGGDAGELAYGQAVAHLRHCGICQARHGVNVEGLRSRFDRRVGVFLPGPAVVVGGAGSAGERVWAGCERVWRGVRGWWGHSGGGGGVRERVVEAAAGGGVGVGVKVAGGLAAVAVLAGGAVGVVGSGARGRERVLRRPAAVVRGVPGVREARLGRVETRSDGRAAAVRTRRSPRLPRVSEQRTAGGFSYLGVPARRRVAAPVVSQRGGGPFSP
jgi:RNA polymerase sigma factor (sigma-70 family)